MYGSGVAIGMITTHITVTAYLIIHRDQLAARTVFCAAVVGTMPLLLAGLPAAAAAALRTAAIATVFGSCFPSK